MATPEERTQLREQVVGQLNDLSNVDPRNLSRRAELSRDINFEDAVPHFEEMIDMMKQLADRDLSRLSYLHLNDIASGCNILQSHIDSVKSFVINQNNPQNVCEALINQVKTGYDAVMQALALPLAFTATQSTDYARIEREAKGYHTTMKSELDKFNKLMEENQKKADRSLSALQKQVAEAGVSSNAEFFKNDSKSHGEMAEKWLNRTAVLATVTLAATIASFWADFHYQADSVPRAIQYVVGKILILSVLSFGIIWCAKNYKSQKHNETLNKHRANALLTFRTFIEGSDDERIKDAILLQAAQAVFVARPTGFDYSDSDPQHINPIVEVMGKAMTSTE